MPTPPSLSRQSSRTGRHHYRSTDPAHPSRSASKRPCVDRRDSSPMRALATYGLLAGTAAIGAAAPIRHAEGHGLDSPPNRMAEDGLRALELMRRDTDAAVDWQAVDYSGVDWSSLDWAHFDYGTATAPVPGPTSTASAAPEATLSNQAQDVQRSASGQAPLGQSAGVPADRDLFPGIAPEQNAMAIVWRGAQVATFHAYANTGPYQPGLGEPFNVAVVQPGGHVVMTFPQGWSGRIQLMGGEDGKPDDPALWTEITWQGWHGLAFADLSCIRGTNSGASLRASDGTSYASIPADIVHKAPANLKVQDSTGAWVLRDTEGYDGALHQDVVDYLKSVTDTTQAYFVHDDDSATHASQDNHWVVEYFG